MDLIFSNNVIQDEGNLVAALDKSALPVLGVGLSFRNEIAHELYAHLDKIDFMEIIVDAAFSGVLDENFYDQVVSRVPVIAHGIDASLGSLELPYVDADYSQRVAAEIQRLQSPWYSEHLAFTRAGGIDAGQLLPVQRTRQMIDFLTPKLCAFGLVLQVPLLIENIAYYFDLPGAEMDEAEFLVEIARRTGCGLLLDLNNLHANCLNHKLDAFAYLDAIPAELVVEVHVAGGEFQEGIYIDTHGHPVNRQVCDLLEYVCRFKRPNSVVLEREKNLPPIEVLIDELAMLKEIWAHSL
jgi:uncharacterized protein